MDNHVLSTHSFIIRIWPERGDTDGAVRWRGHITHVPSGSRVYFEDPNDAIAFITPYLRVATSSNGSRSRH